MQAVELLHKPCQFFTCGTHGHFPRLRRTALHPGVEFLHLPSVQGHVVYLEVVEERLRHQGISGKRRTPDASFRQLLRHVGRPLGHLLLTGHAPVHVEPPHVPFLHVCNVVPLAVRQSPMRWGIRALPVLDGVIPARVVRTVDQADVLLRPVRKPIRPAILVQGTYAGQCDGHRHGIVALQPGKSLACHVHA